MAGFDAEECQTHSAGTQAPTGGAVELTTGGGTGGKGAAKPACGSSGAGGGGVWYGVVCDMSSWDGYAGRRPGLVDTDV